MCYSGSFSWSTCVYKSGAKIKIGVKPGKIGDAKNELERKKYTPAYYDLEERMFDYLGPKSWKISKGSKVMDNFGSGTLACFAQDERKNCFAVTARHVVDKECDGRDAEAEVEEQGEKELRRINLSTCRFGVLGVIDKHFIDIAMMEISDNLKSQQQFAFHKELTCGDVVKYYEMGRRHRRVFMIGAESRTIKCRIADKHCVLEIEELRGRGFFVEPTPGYSAQKGDSGALVCSIVDNKVALGLLSICGTAKDEESRVLLGCVKLKNCLEALRQNNNHVDLRLFDNVTWVNQEDSEQCDKSNHILK